MLSNKMQLSSVVVTICIFHFVIPTNRKEWDSIKCPDFSQRRFLEHFFCDNGTAYVCLTDTNTNASKNFCENISELDFPPLGNKYVWADGFRNIPCDNNRYQPIKLYRNESDKCTYFKTPCSEDGQFVSDDSSFVDDRKCGCDSTLGYKFLTNINYNCIPTEDDCTCIRTGNNHIIRTGINKNEERIPIESSKTPYISLEVERDGILQRENITGIKEKRQSDRNTVRVSTLIVCCLVLAKIVLGVVIVVKDCEDNAQKLDSDDKKRNGLETVERHGKSPVSTQDSNAIITLNSSLSTIVMITGPSEGEVNTCRTSTTDSVAGLEFPCRNTVDKNVGFDNTCSLKEIHSTTNKCLEKIKSDTTGLNDDPKSPFPSADEIAKSLLKQIRQSKDKTFLSSVQYKMATEQYTSNSTIPLPDCVCDPTETNSSKLDIMPLQNQTAIVELVPNLIPVLKAPPLTTDDSITRKSCSVPTATQNAGLDVNIHNEVSNNCQPETHHVDPIGTNTSKQLEMTEPDTAKQQQCVAPDETTNGHLSENLPVENDNIVAVVGIDIGSTYTKYSMHMTEDGISNWHNFHINTEEKTEPTVVILDKATNVVKAFGDKAQKMHQSTTDNDLYFENFWTVLCQQQGALNDFKFDGDVFAKCILSGVIMKIKHKVWKRITTKCTDITENSVKWILTIPSEWHMKEEDFLISCCEMAGLKKENVVLMTETFAAITYYKFRCGTTNSPYLVIDIGGNTCNLSILLNDDSIARNQHSLRAMFGGELFEKKIIALLEEMLGDKVFDFMSEAAKRELMKQLERLKKEFTKHPRDLKLQIPSVTLNYLCEQFYNKSLRSSIYIIEDSENTDEHRDIELETRHTSILGDGDCLLIKQSKLELVMHEVIKTITDGIKKFIEKNEDVNLSTVLLVGGFSQTVDMECAIKKALRTYLVLTENQRNVIANGAVLFVLQQNS